MPVRLKEIISDTFAVLDREVDDLLVFLWDEFPHMVANIRDNRGALAARELLDTLRHLRETYHGVRMVLSGSLGLHHVIEGLRAHGGMWVPTHDMLTKELPSLSGENASYLAAELLRNETMHCDDLIQVAKTIANEVDGGPYYVHHVLYQLRERQQRGSLTTIDAPAVRHLVDEVLSDPLDPWQVQHYVDRIGSYYGEDADYVKAVLDVIAHASNPRTIGTIGEHIGGHVKPPSEEQLRDLLALLCKDFYLTAGPSYSFRMELVRRAWLARRP